MSECGETKVSTEDFSAFKYVFKCAHCGDDFGSRRNDSKFCKAERCKSFAKSIWKKKYRENNRETIAEYSRIRRRKIQEDEDLRLKRNELLRKKRSENPEIYRERLRKHRSDNPDVWASYARKARIKNHESIKDKMGEWRSKNKDRIAESNRDWKRKNPDKVREKKKREYEVKKIKKSQLAALDAIAQMRNNNLINSNGEQQ